MGNALKKTGLGEADYLAGEARATLRSEYVAGEVYAMTGGSARHNRISINLTVKLDAASRGTPCEVFMADMKVKVERYRVFYYPDVMLACASGDDDHPLYRAAPCLIAEVLSPGTANIDEREKWLHYRDIPSLRYYLLIDSERRHARVRSRDGDGWLEQQVDENDIVAIDCGPVHATLCLDDLYERSGL
jgi:Uma2 family endonuclease